jgi:hypothetical protein
VTDACRDPADKGGPTGVGGCEGWRLYSAGGGREAVTGLPWAKEP